MQSFTFHCSTKLVYGASSLNELDKHLALYPYRSFLVVTGSSATRNSPGFARLLQILESQGYAYTIFSSVTPDPTADIVREAANQITKNKHEAVIAYGGGSPIDCAKSAALMASNNIDIMEFVLVKQTPQKPALPVIAIPTTAGTGSEMSAAAVTTDPVTKRKIGLSHPSYFPVLSIVDPELHTSMPFSLTAATGMDALTHVLESWFSLGANPVSDSINAVNINLIGNNLVSACNKPDNIQARSAMAYASATAGMAFSNTGLGMVHGFAHPLGALYGVPHGIANAVMLPYVFAAMKNQLAHKMTGLLTCSIVTDQTFALTSPENLIQGILALRRTLHIPMSLKELGLSRKDIEPVHSDACTYRMRPRSPRQFTDQELFEIIISAYEGDIDKAYSI